ncbi:MAG: hypothetical protein GWN14_00810, partial [candidate division Zixibacteria bacterium]|nr:hypothetical protein [Gammaproteobacteria bacterium]NIX54501.1 hypothetical protein [candidate division Zixibacteria bacterium]
MSNSNLKTESNIAFAPDGFSTEEGTLFLWAPDVSITDNSVISTVTFGEDNAGNIDIQSKDNQFPDPDMGSLNIADSDIFSDTHSNVDVNTLVDEGKASAGDITIAGFDDITLTNSSVTSSSLSFDPLIQQVAAAGSI